MIKALRIPEIVILLPYMAVQLLLFFLIQGNGSRLLSSDSFLMDIIGAFIAIGLSAFILFLYKNRVQPSKNLRWFLIGLSWLLLSIFLFLVFGNSPWIIQKDPQWLGGTNWITVVNPLIFKIGMLLIFLETLLIMTYRFIQIKWLSFLVEILPIFIMFLTLCWLYSQDRPVFLG